MSLGVGRLSVSVSDGSNTGKISGGGVSVGVAVGGAVIENLIIYGEFYFLSVDDPTRSANGGSSSTLSGVSMNGGGIGPGLAYYFQPINLYLSATVGFSKVDVQDKDSNIQFASTKWGFGFSTLLGKEFWVSDNWGLGAALQFHWASMEDNAPTPVGRVHANAISLLFSSTYN